MEGGGQNQTGFMYYLGLSSYMEAFLRPFLPPGFIRVARHAWPMGIATKAKQLARPPLVSLVERAPTPSRQSDSALSGHVP